jgi:hypothetical protein
MPPDPSCPDNSQGETYYVCPAEGCKDYVIMVTDPNYKPSASTCGDLPAGFAAPEPTPRYHLVKHGATTPAVGRNPVTANPVEFSHYAPDASSTPVCK